MQRISTLIFATASIAFGVFGLTLVLISGGNEGDNAPGAAAVIRLLMASVFILLPAFAVSVACKYLGMNNRKRI